MNKLREYFENLEQKEQIMIYLSVVIVFVIIYYLFNLNLQQQLDDVESQYSKIYRKSHVSVRKVQNQLKEKKLLYKKLLSSKIRQDYKYLIMRLNLSNKLVIKEKKFFDILNYLVQDSISKNLNSSFKLGQEENEFLIYDVNISGSGVPSIYNIYSFIKDVEGQKMIKKVVNFSYDNNLTYDIDVKIWSLK